MRDSSKYYRLRTTASSAERPIELFIITNPTTSTTIRIVADTLELISKGMLYTPLDVKGRLLEDVVGKSPRFGLEVNNVNRDFSATFLATSGFKNYRITVIQVMRYTPNIWEIEIPLEVLNSSMTVDKISFEVGVPNYSLLPALPILYSAITNPGLI